MDVYMKPKANDNDGKQQKKKNMNKTFIYHSFDVAS